MINSNSTNSLEITEEEAGNPYKSLIELLESIPHDDVKSIKTDLGEFIEKNFTKDQPFESSHVIDGEDLLIAIVSNPEIKFETKKAAIELFKEKYNYHVNAGATLSSSKNPYVTHIMDAAIHIAKSPELVDYIAEIGIESEKKLVASIKKDNQLISEENEKRSSSKKFPHILSATTNNIPAFFCRTINNKYKKFYDTLEDVDKNLSVEDAQKFIKKYINDEFNSDRFKFHPFRQYGPGYNLNVHPYDVLHHIIENDKMTNQVKMAAIQFFIQEYAYDMGKIYWDNFDSRASHILIAAVKQDNDELVEFLLPLIPEDKRRNVKRALQNNYCAKLNRDISGYVKNKSGEYVTDVAQIEEIYEEQIKQHVQKMLKIDPNYQLYIRDIKTLETIIRSDYWQVNIRKAAANIWVKHGGKIDLHMLQCAVTVKRNQDYQLLAHFLTKNIDKETLNAAMYDSVKAFSDTQFNMFFKADINSNSILFDLLNSQVGTNIIKEDNFEEKIRKLIDHENTRLNEQVHGWTLLNKLIGELSIISPEAPGYDKWLAIFDYMLEKNADPTCTNHAGLDPQNKGQECDSLTYARLRLPNGLYKRIKDIILKHRPELAAQEEHIRNPVAQSAENSTTGRQDLPASHDTSSVNQLKDAESVLSVGNQSIDPAEDDHDTSSMNQPDNLSENFPVKTEPMLEPALKSALEPQKNGSGGSVNPVVIPIVQSGENTSPSSHQTNDQVDSQAKSDEKKSSAKGAVLLISGIGFGVLSVASIATIFNVKMQNMFTQILPRVLDQFIKPIAITTAAFTATAGAICLASKSYTNRNEKRQENLQQL